MNKKKLAPILLLSLFITQSPSRALVGGPFDNNQAAPGDGSDGTYSAIMTGKNLIGSATFGIGSSTGFEGNGRFAVFHEGSVNYGVVSGTADLASKRVEGSLLGVAATPLDTVGVGASANIGTGAGQALTIRSSAEGAFVAVIKGYPVQILFDGDGELSDAANTAVVSSTTVTNTTTTIIVPAAPAGAAQPAQSTTVTQTTTAQPAVTRTETHFKVRGSRTSRTAFTALNSFAALPPLLPSSPAASATAAPAPGG